MFLTKHCLLHLLLFHLYSLDSLKMHCLILLLAIFISDLLLVIFSLIILYSENILSYFDLLKYVDTCPYVPT